MSGAPPLQAVAHRAVTRIFRPLEGGCGSGRVRRRLRQNLQSRGGGLSFLPHTVLGFPLEGKRGPQRDQDGLRRALRTATGPTRSPFGRAPAAPCTSLGPASPSAPPAACHHSHRPAEQDQHDEILRQFVHAASPTPRHPTNACIPRHIVPHDKPRAESTECVVHAQHRPINKCPVWCS